jgi:hypothetical protein
MWKFSQKKTLIPVTSCIWTSLSISQIQDRILNFPNLTHRLHKISCNNVLEKRDYWCFNIWANEFLFMPLEDIAYLHTFANLQESFTILVS